MIYDDHLACLQIMGLHLPDLLLTTSWKLWSEELTMKEQSILVSIGILLVLLTFIFGGFYSFLAAPVSLILAFLIIRISKQKGLKIYWNISSLSIFLLFLFYGISWFWAVDRGMSLFGGIRLFPVVLYAVLLMQMDSEDARSVYQMVPWAGAIMTVLSIGLQFIPVLYDFFVVNRRLAGFFQYANTYALFLLIGLVILATENPNKKWHFLIGIVLVFGILASGSRTSFILMIGLLLAYCVWKRKWMCVFRACGVVFGGMVLSSLIGKIGLTEAERYLTTTTQTSTLLVRLLYYKDALPVIVKHPLGLGYLGYYFLQSSFQTGVYAVRFVHNELLQLLLDVGWIPTAFFCVAIVISLFKRGTSLRNRMIILLAAMHSMIDFDLQFLSIWFLLIPAMDLWNGEMVCLKKSMLPLGVVSALCMIGSIWLGIADFHYTIRDVHGCLQVMPNHTLALIESLPEITDVELLEERADRIIQLDPYVSSAHSAKGNAAFGKGNILEMISEKEEAIRLAPYYLEGYLDYFDKLEEVMKRYEQIGDFASAETCREKILRIPDMLEQVKANTSPIAWKIQHTPELDLPKKYQYRLKYLDE